LRAVSQRGQFGVVSGITLMGAGVPLRIPGVLDHFANHEPATYPLHVAGANEDDDTTMTFAPRDFMDRELPALTRPKFLAIVASNTLAATMVKKANDRLQGRSTIDVRGSR
jgi:nitronate monooxygenase